MRRTLLVLVALAGGRLLAQSPPPQCFYQTAANTGAASYIGNATTHNNVAVPEVKETNPSYGGGKFGGNNFIFDGPVFYIGTACTTSHLTLDVEPLRNGSTYLDVYHEHCTCTSGSGVGQGCTVISGGVVSAGSCPGGGTATMYDNNYDVGLYCIGGSCTFGELYAHIGPIDYDQFAVGVNSFSWQEGSSVTLPVGTYAVGMGTNCDSGSVAGQAGTVSTSGNAIVNWVSGPYFDTSGSWNGTYIYIGDPTYQYQISTVNGSTQLTLTGNINEMSSVPYVQGASAGAGGRSGGAENSCMNAMGEGGGYGSGGSGTGWGSTTQLLSFKDFTNQLDSRSHAYHASCLLYDPYHDGSIGLPSPLDAYDSSTQGCTYVDDATTGISPLSPNGQAPHMIDFAIN